MKKSEYKDLKNKIIEDGNKKFEALIAEYKEEKKTFKERKKEFKKGKKQLRDDIGGSLDQLHLQYQGQPFEKEVKPREKDMSETELRELRNKKHLPFYFYGEEIFNFVTHTVGGGISIAFLIISIVCSLIYKPGNMMILFSMIFFCLTSIALYSVSAIYHGLHINTGKTVFQVLDHCTIYLLIAGTYTPAVLIGMQSISPYHYIFLGGIYLLSILGIVLNATMMKKKAVVIISMILYILIGWGIIGFYPVLVENIQFGGMMLLLFGGINYTLGSILYGIGSKKRYFHSIFHIFVIFGTVLQFLALLLYGVIF